MRMNEEELQERFERLMTLLEKLLQQRQEVHVHVHTDPPEAPAKTIREAVPYVS